MRAKIFIIAFSFFSLCFSAKADGPFGFEMGDHPENLNNCKKTVESDFWKCNPKKPNEIFSEYFVISTEKSGICKVVAITNDKKQSRYGDQIKEKFNDLSSLLSDLYGNPKSYDFLRQGAIWNKPEDWMMALFKDERYLKSIWSKDMNSVKLNNNINEIRLLATAKSPSEASLTIIYLFSNSESCENNQKQSKKNGL